MLRYTLALLARSFRWLAPFLLLVLWTYLVLADPGDAMANAVAMFPMIAIWSTWITVIIGNIDDPGHRDALAAAAGTATRLHAMRAAVSATVNAAVAVLIAVVVACADAQSGHGRWWVAGASSILLLAASLFGLAIGTCLHRPLVRHQGATVLVAAASLLAAVALPPVRSALRAFGDGRPGRGVGLALVSLGIAGAATAVASRMASRRAQ